MLPSDWPAMTSEESGEKRPESWGRGEREERGEGGGEGEGEEILLRRGGN